jgi:hypothetical protein
MIHLMHPLQMDLTESNLLWKYGSYVINIGIRICYEVKWFCGHLGAQGFW